MSKKIHPVILCGGSGTRLWPLSRKSYPKQFTSLIKDESLFQASVRRLCGEQFADPTVITGSDFRFLIVEQLSAIDVAPGSILIEPDARNTAPAICAAAVAIEASSPDDLMLVSPSDHVIPDIELFHQAIEAAALVAGEGEIVTFGVKPNRPEQGYGWLELSNLPDDQFSPVPQSLKSFVEKPNLQKATELLAGGMHLWNAGIFLFSVRTILQAFETHAPDMLKQVRNSVQNAERDLGFTKLEANAWSALEKVSIDYAIMEKESKLSVVPYGGEWLDLGDWNSVWRESPQDENGVVINGPGTAIDCENSLLYATSESQQLVTVGVKDIIAVSMKDAVLVAHKDRAQDVKIAVDALKEKQAPQAETLPRDFRPWGWFESLVIGPRFQVKRIVVNPGAALSLQSHHHRAEHWIVVEGTAKVTIDDDVKLVTENQSVYIPLGAVHRMENPGKVALTLIEVQTGSYLGEDDIIRYEDVYSRGQGAKG